MAKNDSIIIGKLDIDTAALVKSMQDTAKQIDDLAQRQDKLIAKGRETSKEFLVNEAALKSLRAAHEAQAKAVALQTTEDGRLVSMKKAVKAATDEVNKTENDYLRNNERLIQLKKQLNTTDEDYEGKLSRINGKLLENNNWLKENGSEHAKLITTMNDYKQQVIESFDSINIFNGGLSGLVSRAQEAGGAGPLLKNAFNGITGGIAGMTKSAMAFIATPFGIALAAISLAVQSGIAVFKSFAPVVDKVEQVMSAVGAVFESVKNSVLGLLTGATSLGDFFSGFIGSASEAASEAMNLKQAQQELNKEMALQEIANQNAKNSIDEYMATAQDQTKSEEERLNALKQAADVENENFRQRKAIAEESYNIAVGQIANGKNLTAQELQDLKDKGFAYAQELADKKSITQEELDALKEAQTERSAIYAEDKAIEKRQAADFRKIQDEAQAQRDADVAKELARRQKLLDDALAKQKQLLNLYVAESGARAKTLAEQIDYEKEFSRKSIDVLKTELKQKKISLIEYSTAVSNIKQTELQNIAKATAAHAQAELNLWLQENQSKIKAGEALTQEIIDQEATRLGELRDKKLKILQEEKKFDEAELLRKRANNEQLKVEELEYLTELSKIRQDFRDQTAANDQALLTSNKETEEKTRTELEKTRTKEAEDRADAYEVRVAQAQTQFDVDKALEDQRHEERNAELLQRKQDGLITEEQYDALMEAEKTKHGENVKAIDRAVMDNKLSLASNTFGNLATIMGKESAAGKAMAVAQATIDTYKSAVSAYSSMSGIPVVGPALGAVAAGAAVAAGIANVKKIVSTKPPKAEKGALFNIGGKRHSAGGTLFTGADGTQFEAEQGELIGVMNRNAARHFMAFNNAFPAGGASAPNYFASGGIVSREIVAPGLNTDELAAKIADANRNIPAPVVAVQDIITEGNSYVRIRDGANF